MIPTGERLLVEQYATRTVKKVFASKKEALQGSTPSAEDYVTESFTIKKLSKSCSNPDGLKVGDIILVGTYFKPSVVETTFKSDEVIKQDLIVEYNDIVGIDDKLMKKVKEAKSKTK